MTSRRRLPRLAAVLAAAISLSGAAAKADDLDAGCRQVSARPTLTAQLLFGLRRLDGSRIPEAAWRRFLATRVTPRFPAGLTVIEARGQWTNRAGGLIREPARMVLVVTDERPETLAALQAIRTDYRKAFAQDAVGLVLSRSCAAF